MERYEKRFVEYFNDPQKIRNTLADKLKKLASFVEEIEISDRYFPGDTDHNKSHFKDVNKILTFLQKEIDNFEHKIKSNIK